MNAQKHEIVVIGGGAIGIASALWLRQEGHQVLVLEPNALASQCSYGNASTLAEYGCGPVANPSVWSRMPSLLLSDDSPFVIRWPRLGPLMPWLLRFLGQCTPANTQQNTERLARLLAQTYQGYEPLLEQSSEARALIRNNGCLYSYASQEALRGAKAEIELRKSFGIEQQVLDAQAVCDLEPAMAKHTAGGILFPNSCHLRDVLGFLQTLAAPLIKDGCIQQGKAQRLSSHQDGVAIHCEDGSLLKADRVVLAAGAWSAQLSATLGERIPLNVERGYHVEFELGREVLTRPTCPVESAFYMTPLANGRLRAAGTVELGSINDPINEKRITYIEQRVRKILGIDAPISHRWMGMRPTLPDCVPALGPSRVDPRVIHAFGHQHLGITLAGVTGQLVAQCVRGTAPQWLEQYSASRFN